MIPAPKKELQQSIDEADKLVDKLSKDDSLTLTGRKLLSALSKAADSGQKLGRRRAACPSRPAAPVCPLVAEFSSARKAVLDTSENGSELQKLIRGALGVNDIIDRVGGAVRRSAVPEGISVSKPVARVMMLVNAAVWGSGYTMLKHVQENMPTQWMMFFRMASAVLLMAIVFFPRLRRIRLRRYIVPGLILALTYWLGFIFQLKGLETTSPGRNSFFTDTLRYANAFR